MWTKDVDRQPDRIPTERRVRETGKEVTDALNKRTAELEAQIQRINQHSVYSIVFAAGYDTKAKLPDG